MTELDDLRANRLLASVPQAELEQLAPALRGVEFKVKDVVYEQGKPIGHVVFPVSGVMSMVAKMEDGRAVEIATVGNEGMIGLPVFLQAAVTSADMAFAQVPGSAVAMEAQRFSRQVEEMPGLHRVLHRYTQALITQMARSTACMGLHTVGRRACRWLCMTHDRVPGDEFVLTQEFLGQMLNASRSTVGTVAGELQKLGLISYRRGRITVVDRQGLEARSCECYRTVADEYERLLSDGAADSRLT